MNGPLKIAFLYIFFFLDFDALEDEIRPLLDEVSRILLVRRSFSRKQEVACFVVSCSVQSPGLLLGFFLLSFSLFGEITVLYFHVKLRRQRGI